MESQDVFHLILDRVSNLAKLNGGQGEDRAFISWFANLFYSEAYDLLVSDGAGDGKIDASCHTSEDGKANYHVINAKYTRGYNQPAPVQFYEELTALLKPFMSPTDRGAYLQTVRPQLRDRYESILKAYDEGRCDLVFVTNYRRNQRRSQLLEESPIRLFHLEDLVQFVIDDIDGAMPLTKPLVLSDMHAVLNADLHDAQVATSIVFARAIDFIKYMKSDPHDLLFARNVRVFLGAGKKGVNAEIRRTFEEAPAEFAFSNNGITLICEKHTYEAGRKELKLENPRVVNGSQTLHTIRHAAKQSDKARIMVRIIESPVPQNAKDVENRRAIIDKIAVRSNQQNPIKRWNLVSNDEYQLELFRYFRRKNLFYERRVHEWKQRRTHLKSIGVGRGPDIRGLAQVVASFHWQTKGLGPAAAQGGVTKLFEDPAYDLLRQVPPTRVYQYYLVAESVEDAVWRMWQHLGSATQLLSYAYWTVLALVGKSLQRSGVVWGSESLSAALEAQDEGWERKWSKGWLKLVKAVFGRVRREFRAVQVAARRRKEDVTAANFFKAEKQVNALMARCIATGDVELARRALHGRVKSQGVA
jgi:hypothetical protein